VDLRLAITLIAMILPVAAQAAESSRSRNYAIVQSRPGIVGKEEAQGLSRQHLTVNRSNLVRQSFDLRRAYCEVRVKQMRKSDAIGFGSEPKEATIRVECVGSPAFD
jgi:hypothetical protein